MEAMKNLQEVAEKETTDEAAEEENVVQRKEAKETEPYIEKVSVRKKEISMEYSKPQKAIYGPEL